MRALRQPPRYASLSAAVLILIAAAVLFLANQGQGRFVSPASAVICDADSGPAIVTDRAEYLPGEVAIISGCGFDAYGGQTLTLNITEPDSEEFSDNISINNSGGFAYSYVIPDKQGTYNVSALDGSTVLASTTFLDDYYVDPTNLMFVVEQGDNPASQNFTLVVPTSCDDAGGVITDNQSWISTAGSWATGAWVAGPASHVHVDLTVNVTSSALAIGTYTGTVTVDPSDGSSGCSGTKQVAIRLYVVRPNPVLSASCGLDVGLVIDSSGSIDATELAQMKTAFEGFVDAFLPATPTQMSVVDFDTSATALGGGAWSNNATTVKGWVNTPTSGGRTNWDDAMNDQAALFPNRASVPDLIIFASDGNPNEWGGNDGDPLTQDNAVPPITALGKAIDEANAAKLSGIRVLTLGIGNALATTHLAAISSWDAVYTGSFSTLADDLAELAVDLCGGTVTAKKMLDLDNNLATTGDQVPAQNWTMTTNVNSPDFSTPTSGLTDSGGQINFDIDLGGDATATLSVTETLQSGYVFMSAECKKGSTPLGTPGSGTVTGVVIGPQDIVACTFWNLPQRTFTVNKDFIPNDGASVSVSLSCASGTSSPSSSSVTESTPGVFTVTGYLSNPTCTATESPIPSGYQSTGTCAATLTAGSCTIVNTLRSGTFTINKDFIPNNGSSVAVAVTCTSGTPSPAAGSFSESSPLVVTVTGFNSGATCTATETVPGGYTANQAPCAGVALVNGGNVACTITNTLNADTFIVNKDFIPNSGASVSVSVSCTSGTPSPASGSASEATPFMTTISGYSGNPTCTATESPIPTGYNSSGTCNATLSVGQCTITNTQNSATLTVYKDFIPNNAATVSVSVTCTTGTPAPASGSSSEATPFVTTVTGFTAGATCTATETVPSGYTANQANCVAVAVTHGGGHSCTIVNNLNTQAFIVNKDFIPNNGASVSVSISCASGTPTPAAGTASEATPFNTVVTGYTGDPLCTATEAPIPTGYSSSGTCNAVLSAGSCTITNTQNSATFTVFKDFVPNSGASVSVSVTCTNGTPSPASGSASEATPFATTVTGYSVGATCTATETVPSGYTSTGTCNGAITGAPSGTGTCTIVNNLKSGTFTVNKDFIPNNAGSVSVSVSCSSGTPSPASGLSSEATPFVTTVTGFATAATCTATETVPAGYTANQADCVAKTLVNGGNVSCTITNTLNSATLTVNKDFIPNSGASVSVSVTCTSGTPSPASGSSSEATPFVTTVTGFTVGATCTATETVPGGYTANQANCLTVAISVGGSHSCTITNTQTSATLTVNKDFVPNDGASVSVSVTCTSGTPSPASGSASEATPFVTTITGFTAGTTCTATESPVPTGYTASQAACSGVSISNGGSSSCTITNTLNSATLTVNKDFVPNSGASVSVSVACTSGTPSPASGSASEATPFVTTITGFSAGATCTATETVPGGYTANQAACVSVMIINGGNANCTIINTLKSGTFTVNKDFVPNNGASVAVSVSCTSGTPSPASGSASEATPFVTTVTGFLMGATCTATETVPAGYTANQAGCSGVVLSNGFNVSCTITNTQNSATLTVNKDFVPNDGASVSVSVTCTSGTPSPTSGSSSEATPFVTTITGFSTGATCTATETVPAGYTASQANCASVSIGVGGSSSCTITNTLNSATLTVNKDFVPNDGASVSVSVTCTSGTPAPASGSASEATPFVTTITGFTAGATCTATETVPGGYTANQVPCAGVAISVGGSHSCTITNTLSSDTFTVNKDFVPNSGASVSVSVSCASGTPSPASGSASEATPFVTTISGYSGDPLCTATESPIPTGYSSSGTCNAALLATGFCTITNTLNSATLTVNKDFVPNNGASVAVSVTCTSGTPSPASGSSSEATPFVTTITGFSVGATCTATETVPTGYTASQAACASVSISVGGSHSCTITNTLNSATLTVNKDFVPNDGASVAVSVTCTSGTPSPASGSASEATPFVTTITGFSTGATCTATETVPAGYTASQAACASVSISVGGSSSCTITNTLNTATLTVNKDFIPNSGASVAVSVTCTSGTPSPSSGSASEATPFVTTISGFTAGATCTATETAPAGYTADESNCAGAAISVGGSHSCTITNTLNMNTFTVNKDFVPDNGASVAVSITCTSGTPSPSSGSASESTSFVTVISGFTLGTTCTATETVPGGYTANQAGCLAVAISIGGSNSCTIMNTLNSATLTVNKDFIPNSGASVSVSVTCTSGTPSPASGSASEATPFVTTITGFISGASCTTTETEPAGYTKNEANCAGVAISVGGSHSCTITNTWNEGVFLVNKDFSDGNPANVTVSLLCTSGTPSPASGSASEATPFVTTVSGFTPGASCTATEAPIPSGYSSSGTCTALLSAGSCTIVNMLIMTPFTVQKDFVPNSGASVTVMLSCASGTATPSSALASEATPAAFSVSGATGNPTCTATESPIPTGYASSGTCNASLTTGTCTIVNTLRSMTLTVNKNFVPDSGASVAVSVTCTSGTPTPAAGFASEATPFVTTVTGFNVGASCTATETIPGGYSANQTNCAGVMIADGVPASCTITNTGSATFTVYKDFTDNNPMSVTVTLSCTQGTASPSSLLASEGIPAVFTVSGAAGTAVCTGTETSVPGGYTSTATCQATMTTGACTILNLAPTTAPVSSTPTPTPCVSNCPVGGQVFVPVVGESGSGGNGVGLAVMLLMGVVAVASMGGAWKMGRRSRD